MKNLDEELEQAFEVNIPAPDLSKLDRFDEKLKQNKQKRKKIVVFRRVALACAMVLILAVSCMIPILNRPKETEKYYGDNNTIQVSVTQEFIQNYINENLPNYNFIFEDCDTSFHYAYYDEETSSKLLAISLKMDRKTIPFTTVTVNIVLNKNYTYSQYSKFTTDSIVEQLENVKVYTVESIDTSYALFTLLERNDYNTYLEMNVNDTELLNKFKQN